MPAPDFAQRLRRAVSQASLGRLALRPARCPFCGPSLLLRWADHEHAIRCLRCGGCAVHLSLGAVLRQFRPTLAGLRVLELSSRGALVQHLRRRAADVTLCEFFDGVPPGGTCDGIRCEDVQRLTFADASFDIVTHTDVFEHVENDATGFRELRRILAPDGLTIFSVPLAPEGLTRERVRRIDGELRYLLPPEYHDDRLRGPGAVLSWRDYGGDIVARLLAAGFAGARIERPPPGAWFGRGRAIVVATCAP
jgi:SAM-dependent methyltransferase